MFFKKIMLYRKPFNFLTKNQVKVLYYKFIVKINVVYLLTT